MTVATVPTYGRVLSRAPLYERTTRAEPQTITQLPSTVNLVLYRGDSFLLNVRVSQADGQPADLSDVTACAQIRANHDAPMILAQFEVSIEGNTISLFLRSTDDQIESITWESFLAALPAGNAVWDLELCEPGGLVTTIIAGTVTVMPDVTRGCCPPGG